VVVLICVGDIELETSGHQVVLCGRAHAAADEGIVDLPAHEESQSGALLLGHTKLESTVRYLGIEVGGALEMAEQTEV
jgi:hypothetical protein